MNTRYPKTRRGPRSIRGRTRVTRGRCWKVILGGGALRARWSDDAAAAVARGGLAVPVGERRASRRCASRAGGGAGEGAARARGGADRVQAGAVDAAAEGAGVPGVPVLVDIAGGRGLVGPDSGGTGGEG